MGVPELLEKDRFAVAALGARLVEAMPDLVVVEMDVAPHHLDESGRVSSGALFSLADCAMSLISNADAAAVAVATHFTRSGEGVTVRNLRAAARPELPVGRGSTTWMVSVVGDGEILATFTGTTFHLNQR